jgi:hypothetical protein
MGANEGNKNGYQKTRTSLVQLLARLSFENDPIPGFDTPERCR